MKKHLFKIIILVAAMCLIVIYSNWQTALGVYLFAWFNNLERKL